MLLILRWEIINIQLDFLKFYFREVVGLQQNWQEGAESRPHTSTCPWLLTPLTAASSLKFVVHRGAHSHVSCEFGPSMVTHTHHYNIVQSITTDLKLLWALPMYSPGPAQQPLIFSLFPQFWLFQNVIQWIIQGVAFLD